MSGLVRLGEEKDFKRYSRLLYLPAGHRGGSHAPHGGLWWEGKSQQPQVGTRGSTLWTPSYDIVSTCALEPL